MRPLAGHDIHRILVRSSNWIGDAIMNTPVLAALRLNFPGAHIAVLAKPWVSPVFWHNPDVDQVLRYETGEGLNGWAGRLRLARQFRALCFDLALLLPNAFEAALMARLAYIPYRLGYATDGRKKLLTHAVPVRGHRRSGHLVDYFLDILQQAELRGGSRRLRIEITPSERGQAQKLLASLGLQGVETIIGINPGAQFGSAKRWPHERYGELAGRLLARSDRRCILVFGSAAEAGLGEQIRQQAAGRCINLCGRTRLREAIALIERCRLFVTNDSGLMHVAAALDVDQIALFGATDARATGPLSPRSHRMQAAVNCRPCLKPHCPEKHHTCMLKITVEKVADKAEKLLGAQRR